MNQNEVSKLIKSKRKNEKHKNINNELEQKKNSKFKKLFESERIWTIIAIIIIILILLIIIIIFIIYLITRDRTMDIYLEMLSHHRISVVLPSNEETKYNKSLLDEEKICSTNKKFAIIRRKKCPACGLFSYYIVHLGCIINYLKHGYIPIIETASFRNVLSGLEVPYYNPWEKFFNQPCGYTLKEVVKMENVEIFDCICFSDMPDEKTVYNNSIMWEYHHQIQEKYMSIKNEIYLKAKKYWKDFFGDSKNILGILLRGTDYTSRKPRGHSKPPSLKKAINDTIKMDNEYKYDFIFLATEDNKIRKKFIKHFGERLKYLLPEKEVHYNYKRKNFLTFNGNLFGNMNFLEAYLLSIIILSECQDIISARTSGAAGVFILSKGFRNSLFYYLGEY